jgi:hypothetical protein
MRLRPGYIDLRPRYMDVQRPPSKVMVQAMETGQLQRLLEEVKAELDKRTHPSAQLFTQEMMCAPFNPRLAAPDDVLPTGFRSAIDLTAYLAERQNLRRSHLYPTRI